MLTTWKILSLQTTYKIHYTKELFLNNNETLDVSSCETWARTFVWFDQAAALPIELFSQPELLVANVWHSYGAKQIFYSK